MDKVWRALFFGNSPDHAKGVDLEQLKEMEKYKAKEYKITNDIYSLAFAALIDPKKLEDAPAGYLIPIDMTTTEYNRIYLGALLVVSI